MDKPKVWSEWEMTGTTVDGAPYRSGGVVLLTVARDRVAAARFYLDQATD